MPTVCPVAEPITRTWYHPGCSPSTDQAHRPSPTPLQEQTPVPVGQAQSDDPRENVAAETGNTFVGSTMSSLMRIASMPRMTVPPLTPLGINSRPWNAQVVP